MTSVPTAGQPHREHPTAPTRPARRRPLSGTPSRLEYGDYVAEIASVGATVRSLRHRGRDLVVAFEADEVRPAYRGVTLAPWPNRIVDGRYTLAGESHRTALTEPDRGHALHGLVAWQDFEPVDGDTSSSRLGLRTIIEPRDGYPWRVEVRVEFVLDDSGLVQRVTGTNLGQGEAPWGTGPHPYLVAGAGRVDDWSLQLPADEVLEVDERLSPLAVVPVGADAARFDHRLPRRLGSIEIDHAFTGLSRGTDDLATVRVCTAEGDGVAMTFGPECPWVQIHTADLPDPSHPGHRAGLAVEPMTCAPDAFNSGLGLRLLAPGEGATAQWRIAAVAAEPEGARSRSTAAASDISS